MQLKIFKIVLHSIAPNPTIDKNTRDQLVMQQDCQILVVSTRKFTRSLKTALTPIDVRTISTQ